MITPKANVTCDILSLYTETTATIPVGEYFQTFQYDDGPVILLGSKKVLLIKLMITNLLNRHVLKAHLKRS